VPLIRWIQSGTRLAALTVVLLIGADESDAQLANGASFGPAGSGTSVSSPDTPIGTSGTVLLAPRMTAQIVPSYPKGSLSALFNRGGVLGGFAAGFLGSGLLGLLFGRGLTTELSGVPSYLGLILQLALVLMLCRLIWKRWRSDDALNPAGLSPRQLADPYLRSRDDLYAPIGLPACDHEFAEEGSSSAHKLAEPRAGNE
jgi:hypothetical protein